MSVPCNTSLCVDPMARHTLTTAMPGEMFMCGVLCIVTKPFLQSHCPETRLCVCFVCVYGGGGGGACACVCVCAHVCVCVH